MPLIHEQLSVQLTAAERERRLAHRTNNIQALLAYGLGLEASDNGRYEEAARHYREAARLDPGFEAAAIEATRAAQLSQATVALNEIAAIGAREAAPPFESVNLDELSAVRDALMPEGPACNQVAACSDAKASRVRSPSSISSSGGRMTRTMTRFSALGLVAASLSASPLGAQVPSRSAGVQVGWESYTFDDPSVVGLNAVTLLTVPVGVQPIPAGVGHCGPCSC